MLAARLRHFVPTETLSEWFIAHLFRLPYSCYGIRAAKLYIGKLLVLQWRNRRLIYFAPSDAHAIPPFIESKILPGNMICFDTAANLMHDIWKYWSLSELFSLGQIHEYNTRHAAKENYLRKEVNLESFKRSFSRTGAILWNQNSPDWRDKSEPIWNNNFPRRGQKPEEAP